MYSYPIDLTKFEIRDKLPVAFPLHSMEFLEFILGKVERKLILNVAENAGKYYRPFDRFKPGVRPGIDPWRHIDNPVDELKALQSLIDRALLKRIILPETMIGGVKKKSIKDNAGFHIDKQMVVTFDLKNCFPNIRPEIILSVFRNGLKCSEEIARILTQLTTFQARLPQGAPTSLTLANFCLLPLHDDIGELCEHNQLDYSFYVDDIAISGVNAEKFIGEIAKIIQKHGKSFSNRKLKIMPCWSKQIVTGVLVNKKKTIPRKTIQALRISILELANRDSQIMQFEINSIRGKIEHVMNIDPFRGGHLKKLADKMLPRSGTPGKKANKDITRSCNNTHRHAEKHCVSTNSINS